MKTTKFSEISQRALLKRSELVENLGRCEGFIRTYTERVEKLKDIVAYQIEKSVTPDNAMADLNLSARVGELADVEGHLKLYIEQKARIESEIDKIDHPTAAQLAQRQNQQAQLARLATNRAQSDKLIDEAVASLRKLLLDREAMTEEMAAAASVIDLTLGPDGLDVARFKTVLDALPTSLAPQSEQWAQWFVGSEQGKEAFTAREHFCIAETLAHAHVYRSGDAINLTATQARDHLRRIKSM